MQQHLPLAVLKPNELKEIEPANTITVLQQHLPLAVLKLSQYAETVKNQKGVATTPTARGIETRIYENTMGQQLSALQQHLPLAVLKLCWYN